MKKISRTSGPAVSAMQAQANKLAESHIREEEKQSSIQTSVNPLACQEAALDPIEDHAADIARRIRLKQGNIFNVGRPNNIPIYKPTHHGNFGNFQMQAQLEAQRQAQLAAQREAAAQRQAEAQAEGERVRKINEKAEKENAEIKQVADTTSDTSPSGIKQYTDKCGLITQLKYDTKGNLTEKTIIGDLTGNGESNTATTYSPQPLTPLEMKSLISMKIVTIHPSSPAENTKPRE